MIFLDVINKHDEGRSSATETIPKVWGYIAEVRKTIVLLYRQSRHVTYVLKLEYPNKKEKLEIGSRFYGRFYPSRCDLSSDGRYFLYYVMGTSQKGYKEKMGSWTAICRPPFVAAELLFAHGDTCGGGGRFINDKNIYINPGVNPEFDVTKEVILNKYKIHFEYKEQDKGWGTGREWELIDYQYDSKYGKQNPIPNTWKKTKKNLSLLRTLNYKTFLKNKNGKIQGSYDMHSYVVLNETTGEKISLNQGNAICNWADFDLYGRVVYNLGSKLIMSTNPFSTYESQSIIEYDLEKFIS